MRIVIERNGDNNYGIEKMRTVDKVSGENRDGAKKMRAFKVR